MSVVNQAKKWLIVGTSAFALCGALPAAAEITIGLVSSATGAGAGMGIPYRNALALLPTEIGSETVKYIFLDDASDPAQGVRAAHRLVHEDKVDALIGANSMPVTLAVAEVATSASVPFIVVAPAKFNEANHHWAFPLPQTMDLMVQGMIADMKAKDVKTVGYIGYADSWGDMVFQSLNKQLENESIRVSADERYKRTDTSVRSQALKVLSEKPDVIVVGASSSAAALPQTTLRELGFEGQVYQTHATVTADFVRLGGKAVEGTVAPTGPLAFAAALDDSNPIKSKAVDLKKRYEEKYGEGSFNPFVGYVWDAGEVLAAAIPLALEGGNKPGTAEFRRALRDAVEQTENLVGTQGIYNMSSTDHNGLDERARIMITVSDGRWQPL